jgi:3',5'-cyclic AMP phosphodiesterase CpdA
MRILLVTDTHLAEGRPDATANWEAARAYAGRAGIGLTVHLGDITRDGWTEPSELPFAAGLSRHWPTPLRFIPGNHDVGDNPPGEGAACKQPLSMELLSAYRALFGADRWSADIPGWRLVGLNAQLFATGTEAEAGQWDWLAEAVGGAGGRRLAVFSHKPMFQNLLTGEPAHGRYVPTASRRRLLELLAVADWRLWLSGHAHQFVERMTGVTRHVWVPSLAFRFPDTMQERIGDKIVGAVVLTLDETGCSADLVAPDGTRQIEFNPKTEAG